MCSAVFICSYTNLLSRFVASLRAPESASQKSLDTMAATASLLSLFTLTVVLSGGLSRTNSTYRLQNTGGIISDGETADRLSNTSRSGAVRYTGGVLSPSRTSIRHAGETTTATADTNSSRSRAQKHGRRHNNTHGLYSAAGNTSQCFIIHVHA